jgi:hypothetical protein
MSSYAFETAKAQAQAQCIATSLRLGAPKEKKLAQCYKAHGQKLARIKAKTRSHRGQGFDANFRASPCAPYLAINRVPSFDGPDDAEDPKLSKSYLERFQKRLIPYGKRIADCYGSLAKSVVPLKQLKKGRLLVEIEVGRDGQARQVVLVEDTKLDGHVTGCVVRELCGFWASPPPGGKSFYLELPFTFKKPKSDQAPSKSPPRKP